MEHAKLIAGRSNPELAIAIAEKLHMPLTKVKFSDFPNTEMQVQILENVRNFDVYILQTGGAAQGRSVSDHLIELFLLIQACKLSDVASITVITPCYAYARSDKKDAPRVPIGGSMLARMFESLGVNRIVAMDLHSGQIAGFLPTVPFDNLYAIRLVIDHFRQKLFAGMTQEEINKTYVLASADMGGGKRIEAYAKRLGMKHVLLHKHRNYDKVSTVDGSIMIGEEDAVRGRIVLVIDDIIDSGGTMVAAAEELAKHGAIGAFLVATHGIFSGKAAVKINNCALIKGVIVTNTLSQFENAQKIYRMNVIDTTDLFAEVITRLQTGSAGLSELFV